jgi:transcriptional regulator with XRE-family HTH domain
MTSESSTSARRMTAAERRVEVLRLRRSGMTQHQIAAQLGIAQCTVSQALKAALAAFKQQERDDADLLIALECERLDALLRAHWTAASRGHLGATDRCLRIINQRCDLLGLNAPNRHEVTGKGGLPLAPKVTPEQLKMMAEEILAGSEATPPT